LSIRGHFSLLARCLRSEPRYANTGLKISNKVKVGLDTGYLTPVRMSGMLYMADYRFCLAVQS
jgi:hypothetical protein